MAKDVVIPKGMEAYYNDFHFAPAIKDGDRLYCSGQIGVGEGIRFRTIRKRSSPRRLNMSNPPWRRPARHSTMWSR